MKYNSIFLFLFVFIDVLYAQSDFRSAYVITNKNDTIYGKIDYRGDFIMNKTCRFKSTGNEDIIKYSPEEITAFRFLNGKYYVSKKYNNSVSFFEFLIKGQVNIYYSRDPSGEHYYIENEKNGLTEIPYEEKEIVKGGTRYLYKSSKHIGILNHYMKDAPKFSQHIKSLGRPNHKNLTNLAEDYHNTVCKDDKCIIYEKKLPKVIFSVGPIVGMTYTSIYENRNHARKDYIYLLNSEFDYMFYHTVGLLFRVNMPYLNEKLYFQYEITFNSLNSETDHIHATENTIFRNNIEFSLNSINHILLLKYKFPKKKIPPIIQAGFFYNSYFKNNYIRHQHIEFFDVSYTLDNTYYLDEILNNDFGFSIGTGTMINIKSLFDICFDLRYNHGFGIMFSDNIILNLSIPIHI